MWKKFPALGSDHSYELRQVLIPWFSLAYSTDPAVDSFICPDQQQRWCDRPPQRLHRVSKAKQGAGNLVSKETFHTTDLLSYPCFCCFYRNPTGVHRPPSSQAGNDSLVSRRPPSSQTSKARQRPSSQQTKPSSLETTCKELSCLSLLPENFLLSTNVKPKGQDSVAGVQVLPSCSTRNHQK